MRKIRGGMVVAQRRNGRILEYYIYIYMYIYIYYVYIIWCCKMNSCDRELLKDLLQQVHAVISSIHNSYIRFFLSWRFRNGILLSLMQTKSYSADWQIMLTLAESGTLVSWSKISKKSGSHPFLHSILTYVNAQHSPPLNYTQTQWTTTQAWGDTRKNTRSMNRLLHPVGQRSDITGPSQ